jgi:carbon monoxide dehydrogenase subunit G
MWPAVMQQGWFRMPSVAYSTEMSLLPAAIWEFVQEMDNWAPFMLGYQTHEKQTETESMWTLRSDVGAMSRIAKFQVSITEWNGPKKVAFSLTGINEPVKGSGIVTVVELGSDEAEDVSLVTQQRPGFFARFWSKIVGFLVKKSLGAQQIARAAPGSGGGGRSKLTFELAMEAEGPMAPMVNAMITPMLEPMAEQLANKIAEHLEIAHGLQHPTENVG